MKIFLEKGIKMLLLVCSLAILPCMSANAAAKTSVKALKVGSTFTIKNASKVTSSKKRVAKATKKSSNKYKIAAKKKGASTLRVYNKKGRLTKKIYLLAYNGKTFSYNTSTINLAKGAKKTVKASTNQSWVTIKYKSSDTSVAAVNSKGKITAKAAGQATIRALFYYKGKKVKTVNKKVNVCSGKARTAAASGGSPNSASSSDSGSSSKSSGSSGSFKYHSDAQSSYTWTGGKFTKIEVYCEKASDQVTFELSNACVEITDITHSPGYDGWNNSNCYFTGVTVYARVKGT